MDAHPTKDKSMGDHSKNPDWPSKDIPTNIMADANKAIVDLNFKGAL